MGTTLVVPSASSRSVVVSVEPSERADRLARAEQAPLLEHMAEDHHDRQHRRGQQVAARPGGDKRERDQPVGHAVQARMAQAVPGRSEDRDRHEQRRCARDKLRQRARVREQDDAGQCQREQAGGEQGQGQSHAEQQPLPAGQQIAERAARARTQRRRSLRVARQDDAEVAAAVDHLYGGGLTQHGGDALAIHLVEQRRPASPGPCVAPGP